MASGEITVNKIHKTSSFLNWYKIHWKKSITHCYLYQSD